MDKPRTVSAILSSLWTIQCLVEVGKETAADPVIKELFKVIDNELSETNHYVLEMERYVEYVEQQWDETGIDLAEKLLDKK